jgi:hypothetical protein
MFFLLGAGALHAPAAVAGGIASTPVQVVQQVAATVTSVAPAVPAAVPVPVSVPVSVPEPVPVPAAAPSVPVAVQPAPAVAPTPSDPTPSPSPVVARIEPAVHRSTPMHRPVVHHHRQAPAAPQTISAPRAPQPAVRHSAAGRQTLFAPQPLQAPRAPDGADSARTILTGGSAVLVVAGAFFALRRRRRSPRERAHLTPLRSLALTLDLERPD